MKTMLSNPIVPSCTIWLMLLLYFISNSVTHASLQPCATGCSGHGRCNSDSICECMPGWDVAADCSLRSCPSGEAWSSRVDPDDWSRAIMPCSNRGRCDFSTGTCYCFPGASGDACQNSICPRKCSGQGQCVSISTLASSKGRTPVPPLLEVVKSGSALPEVTYGWSGGLTYSNWENDHVFGCMCDPGFAGPDCSVKMCPRGPDPLQTNTRYKSIKLVVSNPHHDIDGQAERVGFSFEGNTAFFNVLDDAATIKRAVEALPNIGSVVVATTVSDFVPGYVVPIGDSVHIYLTFASLSTADNNLFTHGGDPRSSSFFCDVTKATAYLRATATVNAVDAEYDVRIEADGQSFVWRKRPAPSPTADITWSFPVAITASGNGELTGDDGSLTLFFNPPVGQVPGEIFTVLVTKNNAVVLSNMQCEIEEIVQAFEIVNTYTGETSAKFEVKIDDTLLPDGSAQFSWRHVLPTATFEGPFPIVPNTPHNLPGDIAIQFFEKYGLTPGSTYTIHAHPPVVELHPGHDAFLVARGTPLTAQAYYYFEIVVGDAAPAQFNYLVDVNGVVNGVAPGGIDVDPLGVWVPGPDGDASPATGNGIYIYFSSAIGLYQTQKWVVASSDKGITRVIPEPNSPLAVEVTAQVPHKTRYTVTITDAGHVPSVIPGKFTWTSKAEGVFVGESSAAPIDIERWWNGNQITVNGIILRFYQFAGYSVGTQWVFDVFPNGTIVFVKQPETRLRVSVAGFVTTSTYWVRIVSGGDGPSGRDMYEVSLDGGHFHAAEEVLPSSDPTGNAVPDGGIGLHFASVTGTGYAPGQLWRIDIRDAAAIVAEVPAIRSYESCSGRGTCDTSRGECHCFDGFIGADCSVQSDILQVSDNSPGHVVRVANSEYTGSVLLMETDKSPAPDFWFIEAIARGERVFGVRGDGALDVQLFEVDQMTVNEGLYVSGGLYLNNIGAAITEGDFEVIGGSTRLTTYENEPVVDMTVDVRDAYGFDNTAMRLTVREIDTAAQLDGKLFQMNTEIFDASNVVLSNTGRFTVFANGLTSIHSGGLFVDNPVPGDPAGPAGPKADPEFGGISVRGGVEVLSHDVRIRNGGLSVYYEPGNPVTGTYPGAANTVTEGLHVFRATALDATFVGNVLTGSYEGAAPASDDYLLMSLESHFDPKFTVTGTGLTSIKGGAFIKNGLDVEDGLTIDSGGLNIGPGGLVIDSGGLEVKAGGVLVHQGGVEIIDGGLQVGAGGGVFSVHNANDGAVSILQSNTVPGFPFQETLLKFETQVPPSDQFNFIQAEAAGNTVFRVDGLGDIYLGYTGSGGARVRISADGYIQTLEQDDVLVTTDLGQTIIVKAGDMHPVTRKAGDILLNAGAGLEEVDGGIVSFAAGTSEEGIGGHAIFRAGNTIDIGFGGHVSILPGQSTYNPLHAGYLRLLDGAATRTTVFEARPALVSIASGQNIAIATNKVATGGPADSRLYMESASITSLFAGTNLETRSEQLTAIHSQGNVHVTAVDTVYVEATNELGLAGLESASLYGANLAAVYTANHLELVSGNAFSILSTNTVQVDTDHLQANAQDHLELLSQDILTATAVNSIYAGSRSIFANAATVLHLEGASSLLGTSSAGQVSFSSGPARPFVAYSGGALSIEAVGAANIHAGGKIAMASGADMALASGALMDLSSVGKMTLSTPASDIVIDSGASIINHAVNTIEMNAPHIRANGATQLSLFGVSAVLASTSTTSVQSNNVVAVVADDYVSLYGANSIVTRSPYTSIYSGTDTVLRAVGTVSATGTFVNIHALDDVHISAVDQVFIDPGAAAVTTSNVISFHAKQLFHSHSEDELRLTSDNIIDVDAVNLLYLNSGDDVRITAADLLSLYGQHGVHVFSNDMVYLTSPDRVSLHANLIFADATNLVDLVSHQNVRVRGEAHLSLVANNYATLRAVNGLSLQAGISMIAKANDFTSMHAANSFMLNSNYVSLAAFNVLHLKSSDYLSIFSLNQMDQYSTKRITFRSDEGIRALGVQSVLIDSNTGPVSVLAQGNVHLASNAAVLKAYGGAGVHVSAFGAMSLRASSNLIEAADDMLSLFAGQSLMGRTTGPMIMHSQGSTSFHSDTRFYANALGIISVTSGNNVYVRAANLLSLFGSHSILMDSGHLVSIASSDATFVTSNKVVQAIAGVSIHLSAPNYIHALSENIHLDANDVLWLDSNNNIYLTADEYVSMYGANGVVIEGGNTLDLNSVNLFLKATDHASIFGANSVVIYSDPGATLIHGTTIASFASPNSVYIFTDDQMDIRSDNTIEQYSETLMNLRSNNYMRLSSANQLSLFSENRFFVHSDGLLSLSSNTLYSHTNDKVSLHSDAQIYVQAENELILDGVGLLSLQSNTHVIVNSEVELHMNSVDAMRLDTKDSFYLDTALDINLHSTENMIVTVDIDYTQTAVNAYTRTQQWHSMYSQNMMDIHSTVSLMASSNDILQLDSLHNIRIEAKDVISLHGVNSLMSNSPKFMDFHAPSILAYAHDTLSLIGKANKVEILSDDMISLFTWNSIMLGTAVDTDVIVMASNSLVSNSDRVTSLYAFQSMFLRSNDYTYLSAEDFLKLYGGKSIDMSSTQNIVVTGGDTISLRGGQSFIAQAMNTLSIHGEVNTFINSNDLTSITATNLLALHSPNDLTVSSNAVSLFADRNFYIRSGDDVTPPVEGSNLYLRSSNTLSMHGGLSLLGYANALISLNSANKILTYSQVETTLESGELISLQSHNRLMGNAQHIRMQGAVSTAIESGEHLHLLSDNYIKAHAANSITLSAGETITVAAPVSVAVSSTNLVHISSPASIVMSTSHHASTAEKHEYFSNVLYSLHANVAAGIRADSNLYLDANKLYLYGVDHIVSQSNSGFHSMFAKTGVDVLSDATIYLHSGTKTSLFSETGTDIDSNAYILANAQSHLSLRSALNVVVHAVGNMVLSSDLETSLYAGTSMDITSRDNISMKTTVDSITIDSADELSMESEVDMVIASRHATLSVYSEMNMLQVTDANRFDTIGESYTIDVGQTALMRATAGPFSVVANTGPLVMQSGNILSIASTNNIFAYSKVVDIHGGNNVVITSNVLIELDALPAGDIMTRSKNLHEYVSDRVFLESDKDIEAFAANKLELVSDDIMLLTSTNLIELTSSDVMRVLVDNLFDVSVHGTLKFNVVDDILMRTTDALSLYTATGVSVFSGGAIIANTNESIHGKALTGIHLETPGKVIVETDTDLRVESDLVGLLKANDLTITGTNWLKLGSTLLIEAVSDHTIDTFAEEVYKIVSNGVVSIHGKDELSLSTNNLLEISALDLALIADRSLFLKGNQYFEAHSDLVSVNGVTSLSAISPNIHVIAGTNLFLTSNNLMSFHTNNMLSITSGKSIMIRSDDTLVAESVVLTSLHSAVNTYLTSTNNIYMHTRIGSISTYSEDSIESFANLGSIYMNANAGDMHLVTKKHLRMEGVEEISEHSTGSIYHSAANYIHQNSVETIHRTAKLILDEASVSTHISGTTQAEFFSPAYAFVHSDTVARLHSLDQTIVSGINHVSLYAVSGRLSGYSLGDTSLYAEANTYIRTPNNFRLHTDGLTSIVGSAGIDQSTAGSMSIHATVNIFHVAGGAISASSPNIHQYASNKIVQYAGSQVTVTAGDTMHHESNIVTVKGNDYLQLNGVNSIVTLGLTHLATAGTSYVVRSNANLKLDAEVTMEFVSNDILKARAANRVEITSPELVSVFSNKNVQVIANSADLVLHANAANARLTAVTDLSLYAGNKLISNSALSTSIVGGTSVVIFGEQLVNIHSNHDIKLHAPDSITLSTNGILDMSAPNLALTGTDVLSLFGENAAYLVSNTHVRARSNSLLEVSSALLTTVESADTLVLRAGEMTSVHSNKQLKINSDEHVELTSTTWTRLNSLGPVSFMGVGKLDIRHGGSISISTADAMHLRSTLLTSLYSGTNMHLVAADHLTLDGRSVYGHAKSLFHVHSDTNILLQAGNELSLSSQRLYVAVDLETELETDTMFVEANDIITVTSNEIQLLSSDLTHIHTDGYLTLSGDSHVNVLSTTDGITMQGLKRIGLATTAAAGVGVISTLTDTLSLKANVQAALQSNQVFLEGGAHASVRANVIKFHSGFLTETESQNISLMGTTSILGIAGQVQSLQGGTLFAAKSGDLMQLDATNNLSIIAATVNIKGNVQTSLHAPNVQLDALNMMSLYSNGNIGVRADATLSMFGGQRFDVVADAASMDITTDLFLKANVASIHGITSAAIGSPANVYIKTPGTFRADTDRTIVQGSSLSVIVSNFVVNSDTVSFQVASGIQMQSDTFGTLRANTDLQLIGINTARLTSQGDISVLAGADLEMTSGAAGSSSLVGRVDAAVKALQNLFLEAPFIRASAPTSLYVATANAVAEVTTGLSIRSSSLFAHSNVFSDIHAIGDVSIRGDSNIFARGGTVSVHGNTMLYLRSGGTTSVMGTNAVDIQSDTLVRTTSPTIRASSTNEIRQATNAMQLFGDASLELTSPALQLTSTDYIHALATNGIRLYTTTGSIHSRAEATHWIESRTGLVSIRAATAISTYAQNMQMEAVNNMRLLANNMFLEGTNSILLATNFLDVALGNALIFAAPDIDFKATNRFVANSANILSLAAVNLYIQGNTDARMNSGNALFLTSGEAFLTGSGHVSVSSPGSAVVRGATTTIDASTVLDLSGTTRILAQSGSEISLYAPVVRVYATSEVALRSLDKIFLTSGTDISGTASGAVILDGTTGFTANTAGPLRANSGGNMVLTAPSALLSTFAANQFVSVTTRIDIASNDIRLLSAGATAGNVLVDATGNIRIDADVGFYGTAPYVDHRAAQSLYLGAGTNMNIHMSGGAGSLLLRSAGNIDAHAQTKLKMQALTTLDLWGGTGVNMFANTGPMSIKAAGALVVQTDTSSDFITAATMTVTANKLTASTLSDITATAGGDVAVTGSQDMTLTTTFNLLATGNHASLRGINRAALLAPNVFIGQAAAGVDLAGVDLKMIFTGTIAASAPAVSLTGQTYTLVGLGGVGTASIAAATIDATATNIRTLSDNISLYANQAITARSASTSLYSAGITSIGAGTHAYIEAPTGLHLVATTGTARLQGLGVSIYAGTSNLVANTLGIASVYSADHAIFRSGANLSLNAVGTIQANAVTMKADATAAIALTAPLVSVHATANLIWTSPNIVLDATTLELKGSTLVHAVSPNLVSLYGGNSVMVRSPTAIDVRADVDLGLYASTITETAVVKSSTATTSATLAAGSHYIQGTSTLELTSGGPMLLTAAHRMAASAASVYFTSGTEHRTDATNFMVQSTTTSIIGTTRTRAYGGILELAAGTNMHGTAAAISMIASANMQLTGTTNLSLSGTNMKQTSTTHDITAGLLSINAGTLRGITLLTDISSSNQMALTAANQLNLVGTNRATLSSNTEVYIGGGNIAIESNSNIRAKAATRLHLESNIVTTQDSASLFLMSNGQTDMANANLNIESNNNIQAWAKATTGSITLKTGAGPTESSFIQTAGASSLVSDAIAARGSSIRVDTNDVFFPRVGSVVARALNHLCDFSTALVGPNHLIDVNTCEQVFIPACNAANDGKEVCILFRGTSAYDDVTVMWDSWDIYSSTFRQASSVVMKFERFCFFCFAQTWYTHKVNFF